MRIPMTSSTQWQQYPSVWMMVMLSDHVALDFFFTRNSRFPSQEMRHDDWKLCGATAVFANVGTLPAIAAGSCSRKISESVTEQISGHMFLNSRGQYFNPSQRLALCLVDLYRAKVRWPDWHCSKRIRATARWTWLQLSWLCGIFSEMILAR